MGRGAVTPEIKQLAKQLLGIEDLTTRELRLMPYIQYTMMNEQRLEIQRINPEERKILSKWRANGWIEDDASEMSISKQFWDAINQILWLAYVNYDN